MKKLLTICLISLVYSPIYSLLPPLYDSVSQLEAIFKDPTLDKHLNSADVLESLTRTDNGWSIHTNKRTLQVSLEAQPAANPGPTKYKVIWHD